MRFLKYWLLAAMVAVLAACGGGGGSAGTTTGSSSTVSSNPASIEVITANTSLTSSVDEVKISAFVKNASNVAIANKAVTFSASSGVLKSVSATTDANGLATALLSSGSDISNRAITVSVKSGDASGSVVVNVQGVKVTVVGATTIKQGTTNVYSIKVLDGAAKAVVGAAVKVSSSAGNTISPTTLSTGADGTVTFNMTATKVGADTITASALGASVTQAVLVNTLDLTFVSPSSAASLAVGQDAVFTVRYLSSGVPVVDQAVNFSTTRGLFAGGISTAKTDTSGQASVTIKSSSAGPVIVLADVPSIGQASLSATFVSVVPAKVVLQSSLGAVPPNKIGATSSQSTIQATVRDASGNLVAGKAVNFSIISDVSGGYLNTPIATTNSYGVAEVQYIAGTGSTGAEGVVIRGSVQGVSGVAGDITLSVNAKALFINIGYGNTMSNLDETTYTKPFSIYVTDATGNPVGNQQVTISVLPKRYMLGSLTNITGYTSSGTPITGPEWLLAAGSPTATCANTDENHNGITDDLINFAVEGDPPKLLWPDVLLPGNVAVATPGLLTTDASGRATFNLQYGEQYALWVVVDIVAKSIVAGTESRSSQEYQLIMSITDSISKATPANVVSPFNKCPLPI